MTIDKGKARTAAVTEAGIQLIAKIPGLSLLIEGVRAYHENIEEQQRIACVEKLESRIEKMRSNEEWFSTRQGKEFVTKVIATCLNAEYVDKTEFLANALVNGPTLGDNQALRLKFVEMIRQLSKPALEVLAISASKVKTGEAVVVEQFGKHLDWHPSLIDACIRELFSIGAFSNITKWETSGGRPRPFESFDKAIPAVTDFTSDFAAFIGSHDM